MRWLVCLGLCCALTVSTVWAADTGQAIAEFQQEFPDVSFYRIDNRITTVYGPAFGFGNSPEEAAVEFVANHVGIFGAEFEDLEPVSLLEGGQHTLPLMYRPATDDYKFTLVYFSQSRDGIPVFRADVRLLVRNEPGFPLVLVCNGLRELGELTVGDAADAVRFDFAREAVLAKYPGLINMTVPETVIWAGYDDEPGKPTLAVTFVADNGLPATGEYKKRLFVADAMTGEILYDENRILNEDVVGNVSGMATADAKASACGPEVQTPMPYARVNIGSTVRFADQNGDFIIPNAGTSPVTVESWVWGEWFRVFNEAGGEAHLQQTVTPPGPANFLHNQSNHEYTTAEVNGYIHANIVRDFALAADPQYPTIWNQRNWPVNVNINSYCNAYYDYNSINFFRAGGGCNNTAFSDVIYHEYGHHLVHVGGSGQGAYGEGMADTMGVIILDRSQLGIGFQSCTTGIRDANNNMQYPCSGGIHYCGQLLSGCVWSTRNELLVTEPLTYLQTLRDLAINSIKLHKGEQITPQITIHWLTVDDDDANIYNGTPHYYEIAAGFGAHNMDAPPLWPLWFAYPNGLPELIAPAGGTEVAVVVEPSVYVPQPGTGQLHYNDGTGYVAVPMQETTPNNYIATFPAVTCSTRVHYYFSAEDTSGARHTGPPGGASNAYSVVAATEIAVAYEFDFETSPGWTTQSQWAFGQPTGRGGQYGGPDPTSGHTGLNVYGYNLNGDYTNNMPEYHLTSGPLDCSELFDVHLKFWRWLGVEQSVYDHAYVRVSNNGSNWVTVWQNTEEIADRSWVEMDLDISAYADGQPTVYLRWTMGRTDGGWTYCGWNIDDVRIVGAVCGFTKGDMNCDGAFNGADIDPFFLALGNPVAYSMAFPNCDIMLGDMNGDGAVNGADIDVFFECLGGGGCP